MRVARVVCLLVLLAVTAAACGAEEPERREANGDPPREAELPAASAEEPSTSLPDLTRALVPTEALADPVDEGSFAVEECGIQPAFPCVRVYFLTEDLSLDERVELVRREAEAARWTVVSEEREHGYVLVLERGDYSAQYMLEPDDASLCRATARCVVGTMLTVAGPPEPLPAPTSAERAGWTAEKRAFVEDANAVCTRIQGRMRNPDEIAPALAALLEELTALEPPTGEERRVARVLRPLRLVVRAARALTDDAGEDALPAAVAVAEFAKRFNDAASRYGLDACARLG